MVGGGRTALRRVRTVPGDRGVRGGGHQPPRRPAQAVRLRRPASVESPATSSSSATPSRSRTWYAPSVPGWNDGFANYCLVMARAAAQFHRFARFAPDRPAVTPADYDRLVRQVLDRPLWAPPTSEPSGSSSPGSRDLREFSAAHERLLKAAFGSNVLSMVHWRTWRVGVDFPPEHQERLARELVVEVGAGRPAPLMITNFPHEDILNHAVLVYAPAGRLAEPGDRSSSPTIRTTRARRSPSTTTTCRVPSGSARSPTARPGGCGPSGSTPRHSSDACSRARRTRPASTGRGSRGPDPQAEGL